MAFSFNSSLLFPLRSGFLSPLAARLRPTADAVLAGREVQLRLGEKTLTAPLPQADASPQAGAQAVASLLALLDASVPAIGGLRLVVSDRWLRPLVFPLGEAVLSDDELETVLAQQYRQVFGASMVGWHWRSDRQPNGLVLAMAWPDSLLALRGLLAERRIRLVSALPQSLSAIRALTMPSGPAWSIFVTAECVTFVRLEAEGWRQWRVITAAEPTAEFVLSQLLRMVAQLDDACRNVWILVSGVSAEWPDALHNLLAETGWMVHLDGKAK